MHDQPIETNEAAAIEPTTDSVTVNVPAPSNLLPGAKSVALFFLTTKDGISVELQVEGGGDTIDPSDPAHAIAFYVQHNTLELLPRAALWFMNVAKAEKAKREKAANDAPALSTLVTPRNEVAVAPTTLVDAAGQPLPQSAPDDGFDGR